MLASTQAPADETGFVKGIQFYFSFSGLALLKTEILMQANLVLGAHLVQPRGYVPKSGSLRLNSFSCKSNMSFQNRSGWWEEACF